MTSSEGLSPKQLIQINSFFVIVNFLDANRLTIIQMFAISSCLEGLAPRSNFTSLAI